MSNFSGVLEPCAADARVVSESPTQLVTRWSASGFLIELTQTVTPSGQSGSVLTQTYRLTNVAGEQLPLRVVRHLDGDLLFDGTLTDGGAATSDGSSLYEFDSSDDPAEPSTYVGIAGALDGRSVPDRWTIQQYDFRDDIQAAMSIPEQLDGVIFQDFDGDRVVDAPYDVTLSQQWDGIMPTGGQTAFTTVTRFGQLAPERATEPVVARFELSRDLIIFPEQLGLTTSGSERVTARNSGSARVTVRGVTVIGPNA